MPIMGVRLDLSVIVEGQSKYYHQHMFVACMEPGEAVALCIWVKITRRNQVYNDTICGVEQNRDTHALSPTLAQNSQTTNSSANLLKGKKTAEATSVFG